MRIYKIDVLDGLGVIECAIADTLDAGRLLKFVEDGKIAIEHQQASTSAQVPEEKEIPDLLNSYDDMGGYWDIGYAEGWNDCRQAMLNQFSQENKSQEG